MLSQKLLDEVILKEAVELSQHLIQAESISPSDGGLHKFIDQYLTNLGFEVENIDIGNVKNLYAKRGKGPYICFAGHTDVVPPGTGWKHDNPYSGIVEDGYLYGRGSNDMKVSTACAMVAFKYLIEKDNDISLAFLVTSDEEAAAQDGLKKVTPKLIDRGENIKMFILGEPASKESVADTVKIGRRGSMPGIARVYGQQGHIAYPELANNPIPGVMQLVLNLQSLDFNDYDEYFGPTRLEVIGVDSFNKTTNVIPQMVEIRWGIRFNQSQNEESLKKIVSAVFDNTLIKYGLNYEIDWNFQGMPFICKDEKLLEALREQIESVTHKITMFDAKGATSDGRFLSKLAPCFEIGFEESMAHQIDEKVKVDDIQKLVQIYMNIFKNIAF